MSHGNVACVSLLDFSNTFIVENDASGIRVGAVLTQG